MVNVCSNRNLRGENLIKKIYFISEVWFHQAGLKKLDLSYSVHPDESGPHFTSRHIRTVPVKAAAIHVLFLLFVFVYLEAKLHNKLNISHVFDVLWPSKV